MHWSAAGNEVTYTFKVKKSGNYNLAFHYNNGKKEFDTFETIKIDGQVPFKEMYNYKFNPVSSGYANETLKDSNGNNYNFYFEEGTHTITIKQENEPIMGIDIQICITFTGTYHKLPVGNHKDYR